MRNLWLSLGLLASLALAGDPFDVDSASARAQLRSLPPAQDARWRNHRLESVRFASARAFAPAELWDVLDGVGGGFTEIDPQGVLAPQIAKEIQGARQSWLRKAPGARTLLAVLRGKASATLEVKALDALGKETYQVLQCRYGGNADAFGDFVGLQSSCLPRANAPCRLEHADDSRLGAELWPKSLSMRLRLDDRDPFPVVADFARLSAGEQAKAVEDSRAYFRHEYSLAVRSFVETAPGLFGWQAWHWLDWMDRGFLKDAEIRALLESGQRPGNLDLFRVNCQDGRRVRIWSDGMGNLGLELK